jgi:hypothetical protein
MGNYEQTLEAFPSQARYDQFARQVATLLVLRKMLVILRMSCAFASPRTCDNRERTAEPEELG